MKDLRIGYGYDVHRLSEGRPLILGGVEIPYSRGLEGHSDADVLLHAIADALLGALALGDIGRHFPDTDASYRGMNSRHLLREVYGMVKEKGYEIGNIDSTVVAQAPRLSSHITAMRENISEDLETGVQNVSVKATTSEELGFEGRGDGISATAAVTLIKH